MATPWFALQSRFDTWQVRRSCQQEAARGAVDGAPPPHRAPPPAPLQLGNIAMLPCTSAPLKCNPTMWAQMQAYGPAFMTQFAPYQTADSHNGAFLDACLVHGSTSGTINGLTNAQAFQSWLVGNATNGNWWTQKCGGSSTAGPCDRSKNCEVFPQ